MGSPAALASEHTTDSGPTKAIDHIVSILSHSSAKHTAKLAFKNAVDATKPKVALTPFSNPSPKVYLESQLLAVGDRATVRLPTGRGCGIHDSA